MDPCEPDQQTLIAAVDRCRDPIRCIIIETFFDVPGICLACGTVRRIHWTPFVVDFLVSCCERSTVEPYEFKPADAPRHWSSALREHFLAALKIDLIRPIAGMEVEIPGPQCGPGRCGGCSHARNRRNGGPALPQVVLAYLMYGTPVRVLSPSAADASSLWDTPYFSFAIDPLRVVTLPIHDRLIAMVIALRPLWDAGEVCQEDQILIMHMIGAVWARLPWGPWEEIARLAGPMLPWWARIAAPSYVVL